MRHLTFLLSLMIGFYCSAQTDYISIKAAEDSAYINYEISGKWDGEDEPYWDPTGQYFGKCLTLKIWNNTDKELPLFIPAGQLFLCRNPNIQNMVATKEIHLKIPAKQSINFEAYAMCAEYYDAMPNNTTAYTLADSSDSELQKIATVIENMYMQNICGQGAVWAYTDSASFSMLKKYGANSTTLKLTHSILLDAGVSTPLSDSLDKNMQNEVVILDSLSTTPQLINEEVSSQEDQSFFKKLFYITSGVAGLLFLSLISVIYRTKKANKLKK